MCLILFPVVCAGMLRGHGLRSCMNEPLISCRLAEAAAVVNRPPVTKQQVHRPCGRLYMHRVCSMPGGSESVP
jgi:hypothetical protein